MSASSLSSPVRTDIPVHWPRRLGFFAAFGLAFLIWSVDAGAGMRRAFGFGATPLVLSDALRGADFSLPRAAQSTYQSGSLSDLFNRHGLVGGFAAGFLGSGLLGLAFGRGLFGGLSGAASLLGLVFQLSLIAILARSIWARRRGATPFADLSPRQLADAYRRDRHELPPELEPHPPGEHRLDQPTLTSTDHRAS